MFGLAKKPLIEQVEKGQSDVTSVLESISKLERMTKFKLDYIDRILKSREGDSIPKVMGKFYFNQEAKREFLEANAAVLESIEDALRAQKNFRDETRWRKWAFKDELMNIEEALALLKSIKHLVKREMKLTKHLVSQRDMDYIDRYHQEGLPAYRVLAAVSECVRREAELLGAESSKVARVDAELKSLRARIKNRRQMPIVKSKYYHASPFIFNVGDVVKPGGPSRCFKRVEKVFELVRKDRFPAKPSRFNCVYVGEKPNDVDGYGIVYAVEVHGKIHEADPALINKANAYPHEEQKLAEEYWKGKCEGDVKEFLVDGKVVITGLADYVTRGDRIEIIESDVQDYAGRPIKRGSRGKIELYRSWDRRMPFEAEMEDGSRVPLWPASFKVLKSA